MGFTHEAKAPATATRKSPRGGRTLLGPWALTLNRNPKRGSLEAWNRDPVEPLGVTLEGLWAGEGFAAAWECFVWVQRTKGKGAPRLKPGFRF